MFCVKNIARKEIELTTWKENGKYTKKMLFLVFAFSIVTLPVFLKCVNWREKNVSLEKRLSRYKKLINFGTYN